MESFEKTSDERKRVVLTSRYRVQLIDRVDKSKVMYFDCGTDLLFFLSFVNLNLYQVLIDGAYSGDKWLIMGEFIKLDSLVNPDLQQVILSFSRNDYFALRIFFSRLDKENLLGDEFRRLVDRFNNSVIDIVDCSGTSLFDSLRVW